MYALICARRSPDLLELEDQLQRQGVAPTNERPAVECYFGETKAKGRPSCFPAVSQALGNNPDGAANELRLEMMAVANGKRSRRAVSTLGFPVLAATAYPWTAVDTKSRGRDYKTISRCAVVETVRVDQYRPRVVNETPVAHLRQAIVQAVATAAIPVTQNGLEIQQWSFWDNMTPEDITSVPQPRRRSIREALQGAEGELLPKRQREAIRKVIKVVQKSCVATIDGKPGGSLEFGVRQGLCYLVDVSASPPSTLDSTEPSSIDTDRQRGASSTSSGQWPRFQV